MTENFKNTFDVIVIGAGSIGTPTAFYLSKAGLKVLVFEKNASVGQASNKHAIGGIRATHSDPSKINLGTRSLEVFSTWQERYGDDIEWHQGGYSFVAYDKDKASFLRELIIWQQKHELKIVWLNHHELLDAIPKLNPNGLIGGTFSAEDGSASPLLSSFAFHKHAVMAGAIFNFNEIVTNYIMKGNRVTGIRTNRGRYHSQYVINAAGGWARPLCATIGLEVPVTPDSHEAGITEPIAKIFDPMIVDMRSRPGSANFYFYQHPTGKIIFCLTPDPPIIGTHTIASSDFLPKAAKRLVEIMPILKHIRVRRVWRGTYPMTPDGSPIIGQVNGLERHLLAIGMCGQGFMFGPGVAKLLKNFVMNELDETDKVILDNLSFHRNFSTEERLK